MDIITSSRSAVETRLKCKRARMLGYDYGGKGLERKGSKFDAVIGNLIHAGLAEILQDKDKTFDVDIYARYVILETLNSLGFNADDDEHLYNEQTYLVAILLEGWRSLRQPSILAEYDIVDVEVERHYIFDPKDYLPSGLAEILRPWRFPLRMDCLLRRKSDGLLFIMDFKTVNNPTEDWNVMLDNSLQSHLYVEAAQKIFNEPVGGIFYEGLVKGYRQIDKAISSKFNGQTIQYGSFLYGWKDKYGDIHKEYVKGRTREFIPYMRVGESAKHYITSYLPSIGLDMRTYFPNTLPWKPYDSGYIVGQTIVNENEYANNLEAVAQYPVGNQLRDYYQQILFEQNLSACFKYGTKHPCAFVDICHGKIHKDEIKELYTERVDHHLLEVENG